MKRLLFIPLFLYLSNLLLAQVPNITNVEYYIDTDPGYGLATNVSVTPGINLDVSFISDVSALNDGIHLLFIRGKDANNNWSLTTSHAFYKGFGVLNQPITKVEYFFDSDPGLGNATSISFNPATDVDIINNLDVSALQNGLHRLFVRAQDHAGQWTTTKSHTFYKGIFSAGNAAPITTVEYFIDTDPGLGNGVKVAFTPAAELDLTFNVDLSGLTEECHELYIRAQDENESWSLINQHSFCIYATGIFELASSDCLIFPNPSNGNFDLQLKSSDNKTQIEIINIKGEVLFSKTYFTGNINEHISLNQANGVYFVKTVTDKGIRINKLIIE